MRALTAVLLALATVSFGWASEEWMGLFIKDKKVGYVNYVEANHEGGKTSTSTSVIDGKMLGFGLSVKVVTQTWSDSSGRTQKMQFDTDSGGRHQRVVVTVKGNKLDVDADADGKSSHRSLTIPEGGVIADDPMTPFLNGGHPQTVYVFDPNTLELVKCEPRPVGTEKVATPAGEVEATVIDMNDPRAPMKVFLTQKGDLIKAVGPFGMEVRPLTREAALAPSGEADIATASSIKPDKEIRDFLEVKALRIKVTGANLSKLPSDAHQTVSKTDDGWMISIHPVQPDDSLFTAQPSPDSQWLKPDLHVESDSKRFVQLAKEVTAGSDSVLGRCEKIRQFVFQKVQADGGIGVLRDAEDVLDSGRGVCRDHAVLMATLLRADGIPTRLVSGLVYGMGAFYYHAWVEVWTGSTWLGLDSTRPTPGLDATHIKIAEGTVGGAFTSFLLDGAKIAIVSP